MRRDRPAHHPLRPAIVDGVVHYCVANMPAAVPHTSTLALTNATFPYVLKLAHLGANAGHPRGPGIAEGVNTFRGTLTMRPSPKRSNATGSRWPTWFSSNPVPSRL